MPSETWTAERERIGDPPSDHPVDVLRHVVKTFEASPGHEAVIQATGNVYPGHPWTGMTHGDLRRLLELIDALTVTEHDR